MTDTQNRTGPIKGDSLRTKRYRVRKALGVELYEDLRETHLKIRRLYRAGFSIEAIAAALGMPQGTVFNWYEGKSKWTDTPKIEKQNAEKVRNLTEEMIFANAKPKNFVPKYGAERRIQALGRMGWSQADIQALVRPELKVNIKKTLDANVRIRAEVHREIDRIYKLLRTRFGKSKQVATRTANKLYPPPFAWEHIDRMRERPKPFLKGSLL